MNEGRPSTPAAIATSGHLIPTSVIVTYTIDRLYILIHYMLINMGHASFVGSIHSAFEHNIRQNPCAYVTTIKQPLLNKPFLSR